MPPSHLPVNAPTQPSNLLGQALGCLDSGRTIALLTLVNIEGSAPYPIGSQMLVDQAGWFTGQITGGCAEQALADQAVLAIKQGLNQTHRYGLGSPFFDIQLPCGSGIDVHFDVETPIETYRLQYQSLQNRQRAERHVEYSAGQYQQQYLPTQRLLIFGQGPIVTALAGLAIATGFETIVLVQDQADQDQLEEGGIQAQTLANVASVYPSLMDDYTAVVSLFHEHERETAILLQALNSPAFYIGALGSKRTHAQRLAALKSAGAAEGDFSGIDFSRIFGPIGLNIRAQTPSHIAVSILAQIISELSAHFGH